MAQKPLEDKTTHILIPTSQSIDSEMPTVTAMATSMIDNAPHTSEWQPGETIEDMYRIERVLARGGMGIVYLALDLTSHTRVVIKSLLPLIAKKREFKQRFIREAEAWVNLKPHPNIVRAITVHEIAYLPRLVLDYIEGGTLYDLMKASDILPLKTVLPLAIQMCRGMAHAHDHDLIHRDLKPANIMIGHYGQALITDFGLVKRSAEDDQVVNEEEAPDLFLKTLVTQGILGTPEFMAPEQWDKQALPTSDIYAMGVLLHELCYGKPLFDFRHIQGMKRVYAYRDAHLKQTPQRPQDAPAPLPEGLTDTILHCLAKQPQDRPQTFSELESLLNQVARHCGLDIPDKVSPLQLDTTAQLDKAYGLIRLGKSCNFRGDSDKALKLTQQGFDIMGSLQDSRGLASAWISFTAIYRNTGHYDKAFETANESLRYSKSIDDHVLIGRGYNEVGSIYYFRGDTDLAMQNFEKAGDEYQLAGRDELLSGCLNNMAIVYLQMGQYSTARDYIHRVIPLASQANDLITLCNAYNNIGIAYLYEESFNEALHNFRLSLEMAESIELSSTIQNALNNIALVHLSLKEFTEALGILKRSLQLARESKDKHIESMVLANIAEVYTDKNNYKQGLRYFRQALTLKKELGNQQGISNCLHGLGKCYFQSGNLEKAETYFQGSIDTSRKISNIRFLAEGLLDLAKLHQHRSQRLEALGCAQEAITIMQDINHPKLSEAQDFLQNLKSE